MLIRSYSRRIYGKFSLLANEKILQSKSSAPLELLRMCRNKGNISGVVDDYCSNSNAAFLSFS